MFVPVSVALLEEFSAQAHESICSTFYYFYLAVVNTLSLIYYNYIHILREYIFIVII